jgi:hypothetical protein
MENSKEEKLELFKKILQHFDDNFVLGLCGLVHRMRATQKLTQKQRTLFSEILDADYPNRKANSYIWPEGHISPRKQYLNQKIAEYGSET